MEAKLSSETSAKFRSITKLCISLYEAAEKCACFSKLLMNVPLLHVGHSASVKFFISFQLNKFEVILCPRHQSIAKPLGAEDNTPQTNVNAWSAVLTHDRVFERASMLCDCQCQYLALKSYFHDVQ
jgi:hypothetical protein